MLLLLRLFRSSKVAIQVISIRRESDGSVDAASLFKVNRKLFISNKELKRKQVLFQELFWISWLVSKSEFS